MVLKILWKIVNQQFDKLKITITKNTFPINDIFLVVELFSRVCIYEWLHLNTWARCMVASLSVKNYVNTAQRNFYAMWSCVHINEACGSARCHAFASFGIFVSTEWCSPRHRTGPFGESPYARSLFGYTSCECDHRNVCLFLLPRIFRWTHLSA